MQHRTEISAQQTLLFTEEESVSLPVASHVRTHPLPNKMAKVNKGYPVAGQGSFLKWSEQSTKLGQNMLLPRTSRIFLKLTEGQTLQQFSLNFPEWGTMQNGEYAERQKSVRPITALGCIWLLTPTASECNRERLSFPMYQRRHHRSPGGLSEQLYRLVGAVPGKMNPQFYAWMMGYPLDWLDNNSTDTETPSSHK